MTFSLQRRLGWKNPGLEKPAQWVLLSFVGFLGVLVGFVGFFWVLVGFVGFFWGFSGFCWIFFGIFNLKVVKTYKNSYLFIILRLLIQ